MTVWIKKEGNDCPVDPEQMIDAQLQNGRCVRGRAKTFSWVHNDPTCHNIVKYKKVKETPNV